MNQINRVNFPKDLKELNIDELKALCSEIREMLVETVSKTGGHLASNLGVVELTVALLRTFNLPDDKIVYDVGHQSYVHKILTGRKEQFSTLRQYKGISGFPKMAESEYDAFDTGHAGTAVSVAYAFAMANKLNNSNNYSVAVVGDGSLSNGLTMEGLNNAGRSESNLLVVLNDNEMSISKNVGNISRYLSTLRTRPKYTKFKEGVKNTLSDMPVLGDGISKLLHNTKREVKKLLLDNTMFENMGFTYVGPIDGHNLEELLTVLSRIKNLNQPVMLHVLTKKGKGYEFAEKEPNLYHGVSPFDYKTPVKNQNVANSYSEIFGKHLCEIAEKNNNVVALCAAMSEGTGLETFRKRYPKRFFDVGISEGHCVTFASGLSVMGKVPVVAIYSTFMQRAYDNIVHDASIGSKHVVFCLDRAGITGQDGETHHGIFDINFMSHIPDVKIFMPYTKEELKSALNVAINNENCPCVIRYPKGNAPSGEAREDMDIYKVKQVKEGKKATVVAMASTIENVLEANFDSDVFYVTSLSPVDTEPIKKSLEKTNVLITVEDSVVSGGMGEAVSRALNDEGVFVKTYHHGVEGFVAHGGISDLMKEHNLDCEGLKNKFREFIQEG